MANVGGCSHDYANPVEQGFQGRISGIVVTPAAAPAEAAARSLVRDDAPTETTPVQGAVCTLEGTDRSAATGADGSFLLQGVADGSYILICKQASSSGRAFAVLRVVEVQNGASVDLGVLVATQPGAIAGRAVLADQSDHTGIEAYVPGTSFAARTDATGAFLIADVPEGTYTVRLEHEGYLPMTIAGVAVAAVQTTTLADVTLPLSTGASGSIVLADGAAVATSRTVKVTVSYTADATLMSLSEDPTFVGSPWGPVAPEKQWTFASDGEKRLYAKFANPYGLESTPVSAKVVVDTQAPEISSVTVAPSVRSTSCSVAVNDYDDDTGSPADPSDWSASASACSFQVIAHDLTGVTEIMLSTREDFAGAVWQAVTEDGNPVSNTFELPAGDGEKTVYVKARDRFLHESAVASVTSVLDTTRPPAPTLSAARRFVQCAADITVSASAGSRVCMGTDPAALTDCRVGLDTYVYSLSSDSDLDGQYVDGSQTLYAQATDIAGNQSDMVSITIEFDHTPPTAPVIFNEDQSTRLLDFTLTLATQSTDANFANYELCGFVDAYRDCFYSECMTKGWTPLDGASSFPLTLGEGDNCIFVRAVDKSGNASDADLVQVIVDTTPPSVGDISATVTGVVATNPSLYQVQFGASLSCAGTDSWDGGCSGNISCQLRYGATVQYDQSVGLSLCGSAGRCVTLGLPSHSTYHYQVSCQDAVGNEATTDDAVLKTGTFIPAVAFIPVDVLAIADSPYWLGSGGWVYVSTVLTIEPGVEVFGSCGGGMQLQTGGAIEAVGTLEHPIVFTNLAIEPVGSSRSHIEFANFRSSFVGGRYSYGFALDLSDSTLRSSYIRLGETSSASTLLRNRFLDQSDVELASPGGVVTVRNNLFANSRIIAGGSTNATTLIVDHNSFLSTDSVVLRLDGTNAAMTATNNYFGTTDTSVIDGMIWDRNDDPLSLANAIDYTPFLTAPDPQTPQIEAP